MPTETDGPTRSTRIDRIARIDRALAREGWAERPLGVLDLDAFDANLEELARRAQGTPIRVASKSLRVRALLDRALAHPACQGVLAYTVPEAIWLAKRGFDDIVVAYPTAERGPLRLLLTDPEAMDAITLMVDETAQLDLILDATADMWPRRGGRRLRIAIELDVSYVPVRGLHVGALRSPVRTPEQGVDLALAVTRRPELDLVGLMAYEGHIAGVADDARTPYGAAVRAMKALSRREIAQRRADVVAAVRTVADLEFVNGGGTGSIESTGAEPAVTEIAAGSGLIGPGLFDGYRGFRPQPALHLGFSVVRRPAPGVATLLGGGWIASGVPGPDRQPTIAHPAGLSFAPQEGAGEVQTPVLGAAADALRVGDTVWLRHAKAGEPAEHLLSYVLVAGVGSGAGAGSGSGSRQSDDADQIEVVEAVPTYRGEGAAFL